MVYPSLLFLRPRSDDFFAIICIELDITSRENQKVSKIVWFFLIISKCLLQIYIFIGPLYFFEEHFVAWCCNCRWHIDYSFAEDEGYVSRVSCQYVRESSVKFRV